jgi:hypothetical protein
MHCPRCRFDNPEEMRFCGKCGASLGDATHEDRFSLLHDYVPPELKERILQAGKQIESQAPRASVRGILAKASENGYRIQLRSFGNEGFAHRCN